MSVFQCEKCKCVENTATSNYWSRKHQALTVVREITEDGVL